MKATAIIYFLFLCLFAPSTTLAQYVQYGGVTTTQPGKLAILEKKILNPQNNQFVDNLNFEQHTFLPGQEVIFRVTVTNITQSDLKNLLVTDKLPDVLDFVSTSFGNFDSSTRSININLDTLKTGESKTFEIKTKVKSIAELPNNVTCQTNLSRIAASNTTDEDTSTFCVSKQVLGTSSAMPKTGPSQTLALSLLSFLFLSIGFLLKRIIILERR